MNEEKNESAEKQTVLVSGGIITLNGKPRRINLPDGVYTIRKLTEEDVKRLRLRRKLK